MNTPSLSGITWQLPPSLKHRKYRKPSEGKETNQIFKTFTMFVKHSTIFPVFISNIYPGKFSPSGQGEASVICFLLIEEVLQTDTTTLQFSTHLILLMRRRKKKKPSNKILGSNRFYGEQRSGMELWNASTNSMTKGSILPQNPSVSPLERGQGRATRGVKAAGEQENFGIGNGESSVLLWEVFLGSQLRWSQGCAVVTRTGRGTWSRI